MTTEEAYKWAHPSLEEQVEMGIDAFASYIDEWTLVETLKLRDTGRISESEWWVSNNAREDPTGNLKDSLTRQGIVWRSMEHAEYPSIEILIREGKPKNQSG